MECDGAGILGIGAIGFEADPYHFSGCEQFVEHARLVIADPCRKHRGFPYVGIESHAFELFDDAQQPVGAFISGTAHRSDALAIQQERLICRLVDWFDGTACFGEG